MYNKKSNGGRVVVNYLFTGGPIAAFVMYGIALAVLYCALIGMPFPEDLESLTFWTLILAVGLPIIPYICYGIGFGVGSYAGTVAAFALLVLCLLWHTWTAVWLSITLATCDGDVHCADNLSCDGVTVTGTYGGPTDRFIVVYISNFALMLIEVFILAVTFPAIRKIRAVHGFEAGVIGSARGRNTVSRQYASEKAWQSVAESNLADMTIAQQPPQSVNSEYGADQVPSIIHYSGGVRKFK